MAFYKTIIRHVATYSIGIVCGRLVSLLVLPIYTRFLTPADYGALELLEISSNVINSLTAFHLTDALFFFYAKEPDERGRRTVITTAYMGTIIGGLSVGVAGFYCSPLLSRLVFGSPAYRFGFQLVAIGALFGFAQELGFAHLQALNRSTAYLVLQLVRLVFQCTVTIVLLVFFGRGYLGVLLGSAITFAAMAIYFLAQAMIRHRGQVRFPLLGAMFRYAFPLGLSGVAMLFLHFGDRFFLQRAVPLSSLGLYSLAYKVGMSVGIAQLAFVTYWKAQMFAVLRGEGGARNYVRLFTYYILLLTATAVVIAAGSGPGLELLTTKPFHPAIVFIPLLTGAYVIRGAGDFLRTPLLVENLPGINARVMIATAIICLVLYALAIPRFHVWGAAGATFLAFVCMTALSYWEAQRVRRFSFEYARIAQIVISGAASLLVIALLHPAHLLAQIGVSVAGALVFAAGLLISNFFQQSEKEAAMHAWVYARGWLTTVRSARRG